MSAGISVGDKVSVKGEGGVVRFIGNTQFADGEWVGVELDTTLGKNNGEVNGVRYFNLEKQNGNYGIFVRPLLIERNETSLKVGKIRISRNVSTEGRRPVSYSARSLSGSNKENEAIARNRPSTSLDTRSSLAAPELKEDDRNRLHSIILTLQNKVKKMHDDIDTLKLKLETTNSEKLKLKESLELLEVSLEHKTIDYELLEEQKLELQSKLADMEAAYDLVNKQLEDGKSPSFTSNEDNELLREKTELLSAALNTLREQSAKTEMDLLSELQLRDTQSNHLSSLELKLNRTEIELDQAYTLIESLKGQLDSSLSGDEVVENLTQKNLELTEKVETLKVTVEQLEQLHALDEEVLNNHIEIETELREDIELLQIQTDNDQLLIEELKSKISSLEERFSNFNSQEQILKTVTKPLDNKTFNAAKEKIMILERQKSELALDNNFKELEISKLLDFVSQTKNIISDQLSSSSVEMLHLHLRFSLVIDKISLIYKELSNSNEDVKVVISQRYSMLVNFGEIVCSLQFFLNVLEFNKLRSEEEMRTMIDELENLTVECFKLTKLMDNEGLNNLSQTLAKKVIILHSQDLFETLNFFNREVLRYKLSVQLECFVSPNLWLIDIILNEKWNQNDEKLDNFRSLLTSYFFKISQLRGTVQCQLNELAKLVDSSFDIDNSLNFEELSDFQKLPYQIASIFQTEFNSISNDEFNVVNQILDATSNDMESGIERLKIFEKEIQKWVIAKKFCDVKPIILKNQSDLLVQDATTTKEYESLKEEVLRISQLMTEKETSLEELTLKISVLNRKLNESDQRNVSIAKETSKVHELAEKNLQLLKELQEVKKENVEYLNKIEELKQQSKSLTGNFDNIHEEKEFVEKSSLIGEIHSLRNTLNHQLIGKNRITEDWLFTDFSSSPRKITEFTATKAAYKKLMSLTSEFSVIPVSSKRGSKFVPKYYTASMVNEYNNYEKIKSRIA